MASPVNWHCANCIGALSFSISMKYLCVTQATYTHTHIRLMALCPGLTRWAGTRKVKPIWILLKQETVSGNGISWDICKSAPHSRQITMPAPHRSVFYRPDALPAAQPTASKHWRQRPLALHRPRTGKLFHGSTSTKTARAFSWCIGQT